MSRSLLLVGALLPMPFVASADGRAPAPACKALTGPTYSVVNKTRVPPSGDLKPGPDEGSSSFFSRAAWAYGDMEYRRAAGVLAEYNPTIQIHLTMARP